MVFMPHWPTPLGSRPMDFTIDRIKDLLSQLGNPHKNLPPVVHVAGTNGKGSTIAFLRTILECAGYKVHVYTSPHLIRFNERIYLSGSEISDEFLYEVCEQCRIAAEQIGLKTTFFEGTTAAAFLAFSKVPADIVLVETGLGGRLDATNVFDKPRLNIITSISYDHMEYLGNKLAMIAYEKSGILKENVTCILSRQYPDVEAVFEKRADDLGIELKMFGYDFGIAKSDKGIKFQSPSFSLELPELSLAGDHQVLNACNAIAASQELKEFELSEQHIVTGLSNTHWPARLQKLNKGPVVSSIPDEWEIWVDGAHNNAAAHMLSVWAEDNQDKPLYLLVGMTKGRDCRSFLSHFKSNVSSVYTVLVEAEPSSHPAKIVSEAAQEAGMKSFSCESIDDALSKIIKGPTGRILVCGSLYLAGDILNKNQKMLASSSV